MRSHLLPGSCRSTLALLSCLLLSACSENRVNQSNYDKIETGMTVQQVEAILGSGKEVADVSASEPGARIDVDVPGVKVDVDVPGKGGKTRSTRIMKWENGDQVITVTFVDGKVQAKTKS